MAFGAPPRPRSRARDIADEPLYRQERSRTSWSRYAEQATPRKATVSLSFVGAAEDDHHPQTTHRWSSPAGRARRRGHRREAWLELMHASAMHFPALTDADFVTERTVAHPGHEDVLLSSTVTLV